MKITVNDNKTERNLVGLLSKSGTLLLPFQSHKAVDQRTASIGCSGIVGTNGTGSIQEIQDGYTRIYEGDTVTLQF